MPVSVTHLKIVEEMLPKILKLIQNNKNCVDKLQSYLLILKNSCDIEFKSYMGLPQTESNQAYKHQFKVNILQAIDNFTNFSSQQVYVK